MLFFTLLISEQLVHLLWVHMAVDVIADDNIGGQGADADAGHGFQRLFQVGSSLTLIYL